MIKFYKYKNILSTSNQLQKNDFDYVVEKFEVWLKDNPQGGIFLIDGQKFNVLQKSIYRHITEMKIHTIKKSINDKS
jgi:hypothetical protein